MLGAQRKTLEQRKAFAMRTPGMTALKQISGLQEVAFSGNCEIIEAMLKPLMERPVSKKRENVAREVEDWGRPKRAVRAKKAEKKS